MTRPAPAPPPPGRAPPGPGRAEESRRPRCAARSPIRCGAGTRPSLTPPPRPPRGGACRGRRWRRPRRTTVPPAAVDAPSRSAASRTAGRVPAGLAGGGLRETVPRAGRPRPCRVGAGVRHPPARARPRGGRPHRLHDTVRAALSAHVLSAHVLAREEASPPSRGLDGRGPRRRGSPGRGGPRTAAAVRLDRAAKRSPEFPRCRAAYPYRSGAPEVRPELARRHPPTGAGHPAPPPTCPGGGANPFRGPGRSPLRACGRRPGRGTADAEARTGARQP